MIAAETLLSDSDLQAISFTKKSLFETVRKFHGNPQCMLYRYTVTGDDPSIGSAGTKVNFFGSVVYDCLVLSEPYDAKNKTRRSETIDFTQPDARLFIVYDVDLKTTDTILYPFTSNQLWEIISAEYTASDGRCCCEIHPLNSATANLT